MKRLAAISVLSLSTVLASAQDWANFSFYNEANAGVSTRPAAVLMGDSITQGWAEKDPDFFTANNFVGRGISGQCTSQMLVRFRRDVIDLAPGQVVILAGINDIAMNTGSAGSVDDIFGNIVSMCELAKAHRIRPVLCTLTPASAIPWRNDIDNVVEKVQRLNSLIREYAAANRLKFVDYHTPLAEADGGFPKNYSADGIHPLLDGYKVMEEILLKVLR